jgi:hypothetical protein
MNLDQDSKADVLIEKSEKWQKYNHTDTALNFGLL